MTSWRGSHVGKYYESSVVSESDYCWKFAICGEDS